MAFARIEDLIPAFNTIDGRLDGLGADATATAVTLAGPTGAGLLGYRGISGGGLANAAAMFGLRPNLISAVGYERWAGILAGTPSLTSGDNDLMNEMWDEFGHLDLPPGRIEANLYTMDDGKSLFGHGIAQVLDVDGASWVSGSQLVPMDPADAIITFDGAAAGRIIKTFAIRDVFLHGLGTGKAAVECVSANTTTRVDYLTMDDVIVRGFDDGILFTNGLDYLIRNLHVGFCSGDGIRIVPGGNGISGCFNGALFQKSSSNFNGGRSLYAFRHIGTTEPSYNNTFDTCGFEYCQTAAVNGQTVSAAEFHNFDNINLRNCSGEGTATTIVDGVAVPIPGVTVHDVAFKGATARGVNIDGLSAAGADVALHIAVSTPLCSGYVRNVRGSLKGGVTTGNIIVVDAQSTAGEPVVVIDHQTVRGGQVAILDTAGTGTFAAAFADGSGPRSFVFRGADPAVSEDVNMQGRLGVVLVNPTAATDYRIKPVNLQPGALYDFRSHSAGGGNVLIDASVMASGADYQIPAGSVGYLRAGWGTAGTVLGKLKVDRVVT